MDWHWSDSFESAFDALDHFLSGRSAPRGDWTGDEWGDYASNRAGEILADFGTSDWRRLSDAWKGRPSIWQQRLTELLLEGPPDQTVPLLLEMTRSSDGEVACQAMKTLGYLYYWRKEYQQARQWYERAAETGDEIARKLLEDLIREHP